jgi:ketosteroid isomerase-like protein
VTAPNAERARAAYEAFARRDREGMLAFFSPDVVWHDDPLLPGADTHRGHEGLLRLIESFDASFESFRFEVEEIDDFGDGMLVVVRAVARGSASSIDVDARAGHLIALDPDGRAREVRGFFDLDVARDAATVAKALTSWHRGDERLMREVFDPGAVWLGHPGAEWRGHDDLACARASWMSAWGEYEFHFELPAALGSGAFLVRLSERGSGKGSGAEASLRQYLLFRVAGGRIVRGERHADEQAALAAAAALTRPYSARPARARLAP